MNYQRLEAQVKQDEGFRAKPYLDSLGYPTIGYGNRKILGRWVNLETDALTEEQATELLRADLYTALRDAQQVFCRFNQLDHVRQEVLVNMAFILGLPKLKKFRHLIRAQKSLDYLQMSIEIEDSLMHRQIGERGKRFVRQMRTGRY